MILNEIKVKLSLITHLNSLNLLILSYFLFILIPISFAWILFVEEVLLTLLTDIISPSYANKVIIWLVSFSSPLSLHRNIFILRNYFILCFNLLIYDFAANAAVQLIHWLVFWSIQIWNWHLELHFVVLLQLGCHHSFSFLLRNFYFVAFFLNRILKFYEIRAYVIIIWYCLLVFNCNMITILEWSWLFVIVVPFSTVTSLTASCCSYLVCLYC